MKRLRFFIALTNDENDYQIEQAASARHSARKLGADLQILYAQNDAILQSQQLLKIIHSAEPTRPDGIIFEPAGGTAMPQVAGAALAAGIGWVILNRDAEYLAALRDEFSAPAFAVSSDHEEIGRLQGKQLSKLLSRGGSVLYIQGPAESLAAKQRLAGLLETKPQLIKMQILKAQWSESSAQRVVTSWLSLATSRVGAFDLIAAQDDSMAMGARKAFLGISDDEARKKWLSLPFIGCDGLPATGQCWVRSGCLAATIFIPPNAGIAVEMLFSALRNRTSPSKRTLTAPISIPPLQTLAVSTPPKSGPSCAR